MQESEVVITPSNVKYLMKWKIMMVFRLTRCQKRSQRFHPIEPPLILMKFENEMSLQQEAVEAIL